MKKQVLIAFGSIVLFGITGIFVLISTQSRDTEVEFLTHTEVSLIFSWRFETLDTNGSPTPHTRVFMSDGMSEYDLGVYEGTCFSVSESAWELLPGEISGAICWWAGGGKEIGVFLREGVLSLEEGFLEEGSETSSGFRGDFTPHGVLLPGYAEVR